MNEKMIERMVQRSKVISEVKSVKIYVCVDGREFDRKEDAVWHEKINDIKEKLKYRSIDLWSQIDGSSFDVLYIKELSSEVGYLLKDLYSNSMFNVESFHKGWNLIQVIDGGDYADSLRVMSVDDVIKDLKKDVETLENLKSEL